MAWYLVLDSREGTSLRETLDATPASPSTILSWAAQICDGLAAVELAGQPHADLTPDNVLVGSDGLVTLLAPSIARLAGGPVTDATAGFTSPEVAAGAPDVGAAADLFSLGCLLYFLVTGRAPITGAPADVLARQREVEPEPTWRHAPMVPQRLDRLIMELLRKDPSLRPPDAGEVGRRLREIAEGPLPPAFGEAAEEWAGTPGSTDPHEPHDKRAASGFPGMVPRWTALVTGATVAAVTWGTWTVFTSVGAGWGALVTGAVLAVWLLTIRASWDLAEEDSPSLRNIGVWFAVAFAVGLAVTPRWLPGAWWVVLLLVVPASVAVAVLAMVLCLVPAGTTAGLLRETGFGSAAAHTAGAGSGVLGPAVGAAVSWSGDNAWTAVALWTLGTWLVCGVGLSLALEGRRGKGAPPWARSPQR
ncbi:serine/threonine protein kinase [Streptomyces rubiginosohelvolus]|uniref:serine/threonine protein kinase n=1 Tax=Streptomyces rubiginosohelvolus TaxID=67362 RepID=UPI003675188C